LNSTSPETAHRGPADCSGGEEAVLRRLHPSAVPGGLAEPVPRCLLANHEGLPIRKVWTGCWCGVDSWTASMPAKGQWLSMWRPID